MFTHTCTHEEVHTYTHTQVPTIYTQTHYVHAHMHTHVNTTPHHTHTTHDTHTHSASGQMCRSASTDQNREATASYQFITNHVEHVCAGASTPHTHTNMCTNPFRLGTVFVYWLLWPSSARHCGSKHSERKACVLPVLVSKCFPVAVRVESCMLTT